MKLTQLIDYSIGLSAVPASSAGFSVPLLLVDDTAVPIDTRYRQVTRDTYATALSGAAEDWAAVLWGQNYNPASAYVGRWVSAASSPHFVMPSPGSAIPTWAAITVGDFAVFDGTNTVEVSTGTMAAVTDLPDIAAVIQTALQALVAPSITGLETATCAVDALGRLVITNSTTGSTAATITIIAPTGGAGTDITTSGLLNIAAGFGVAGLDAEDPDDALAAILVKDNTPFIVHEIGASIAQQQALAIACAAQKKFYEVNVRDADAKNASATSDIAYILNGLGNNNAHGTYTEHTGQYPSAAIGGEIMPLPEGTGQLSNHTLAQVYESGLDPAGGYKALTDDERSALEAKGCDYLIRPVTLVHLRHGLTFGGIEVRHRLGYYWAEARTTEEIYAYLMVNRVTTFSDKHIQAIGAIVAKYLDILVERECCEPGYTLNLPSAADISLVEKATHTLTLSDVAAIISQYAINDVVLTATATV